MSISKLQTNQSISDSEFPAECSCPVGTCSHPVLTADTVQAIDTNGVNIRTSQSVE